MGAREREPRIGDEISVARTGHAAGAADAAGQVLEVLGAPEAPLYRVRWTAGYETMYRPERRLRIVRRSRRRRGATAAA